MTAPHHCIDAINHSSVMVEERGRKARFANPDRSDFHRAKVDGCLVTDGQRADWIITKLGVGSVVVELKGKDVNHACDQIFATIQSAECEKWIEKRKAGLIVCSRYPSFDTKVARAKLKARKLGVNLTILCKCADLTLEDLL